MNKRSPCAVAILLTGFNAFAADIAREIQHPGYGKGSFAEFGFALAVGSEPLVGFNGQTLEQSGDMSLSLSGSLEGRLEYKRVFVEFIDNSFSNASIGINAYSTDKTNHDIILTTLFGGVNRSDVVGFETIENRKGDINLGFRSSYYFGDGIAQFELVSDVSSAHDGVIASLQFGHQAQVRNWNLHALAGVRYFTDNVVDQLFGVSSSEATETLPEYQADSGFMPTLQLGATLPLNEKWIFRANAEYTRYPSSVVNSPLAQGDSGYLVSTGIYYVLHGS